ncbi:MAG TPA: ATP-dependent DNA helicase RecG [Actinomycetes bacterium]
MYAELWDEPAGRLVGGTTAQTLSKKLGIETVGDLLRHYPRRYAERGELTDLASLRVDDDVTVMADIASAKLHRMKNRPGTRLQVVVTDGRGYLTLTFFDKRDQRWRERELRPGRRGLFAGKVSVFNGARQLTHPEYLLVDEGDDGDEVDAQAAAAFAHALIPVYPATAGFPSWRVAKAVQPALDVLGELPDPVPDDVRERRGLVGLAEALRLVHRPETRAEVASARRRLVYEEAFVLQTELARRRAATAALPAVARRRVAGGLVDAFDARLPFTLTDGQQAVAAQLERDLAMVHPMHRLLQGEVGSGKTVLALRAMLTVVDAGGQAALLAPTEVLAQQHYRSVLALLGPLAERGLLGGADVGTRVVLLTGSSGAATRREGLLQVASGDAGLVIGTHALLEERVGFFDLGLVVVDEQHRFGVEQRAALSGKGAQPPHVLVMTATPIPRTVAMTVFGDLEVSTLTELPRGRSPIATHVVPADRPRFVERSWERVREEVAAGHQAYVVCPRIGDSPDPDDVSPDGDEPEGGPASRPPRAVTEVAPELAEGPLAGLRLEVLHGRLPSDVKDDVMRRFAAGQVDVLVATTVVEVGVDVPNATTMVVMDADRFGVSQLHQLRGRVGRGAAPGLCLLVTDQPEASPARERLDSVAATLDGFVLSRLDLEQRREGDVLGSSQHGRRSSLRLLSVLRDEDTIADAREDAAGVVAADPDLDGHPALRTALAQYVDDERAEFLEKA